VADILLTHSYHLFYDVKQVRKMQPYPPLGTLYAAALLRQQGFSVAVFDAMLEDPERGLAAALDRHRPRLVAIYEDNFNFLSKMCLTRMRQIAYGAIEAARRAGAFAIVNGSDATDHAAEYLWRGAHFVLLGEAEWTLVELSKTLLGRTNAHPATISGLAYADARDRHLCRTTARPLMRDLDTLPTPARDLVDIEAYRSAWKAAHGLFSLNLVASRGCPYHCNWCAKPIYGQTFHVRSAACVAEEMKELKEVHGAEHLWFADDIFGLKPHWLRELADHVESRQAQVAFKAQCRIDLMAGNNVQALRRAGCTEIWLGVESGSQKILNAMEKGTRVQDVITVRQRLRASGIRACFFLQFGYPGEEWEDIQATIRLVRDAQPDDIGVSVSYPLPGTTFYDRVSAQLGEKKNWIDSDDLAVMFKGAYRSEFYYALRTALHAEVDLRRRPLAADPWSDGAERPAVSSSELARLWNRVEDLERTCRNSDRTLLPALPGPLPRKERAYPEAGAIDGRTLS
jgi:anaerobic magnesium-protoporphyrin IX monomethyl ester cyclase